jgi:hypothetical protein
MAEYYLCGLEAILPANLRRPGMAKPIWGPTMVALPDFQHGRITGNVVGRRKSPVARAMNGPAVGGDSILIAWRALGFPPTICTRPISTRQRRHTVGMGRCPPFCLGVAGPEAERFGVTSQIPEQNSLGPGTDENETLPAGVLRLVMLRHVPPRIDAAVDITRAHVAQLGWSHAGKSLDPHHVCHHFQQVGKSGINGGFIDR